LPETISNENLWKITKKKKETVNQMKRKEIHREVGTRLEPPGGSEA
jgi:hypothetical protein